MKVLILLPIMLLMVFFVPQDSFQHRDGCHAKHSCPSDTGSYICGDKGYYDECPTYKPKVKTPINVEPPATWPKYNETIESESISKPIIQVWKNLRGEMVIIFYSSVDELIKRGYLIEKILNPGNR